MSKLIETIYVEPESYIAQQVVDKLNEVIEIVNVLMLQQDYDRRFFAKLKEDE